MTKSLSFEKGLNYPWGHAKRLWYILWALVPILGIFALIAYCQKIVQALVKGDYKGLPKFGDFWDNTGKGLMLFIKMVPTFIVLGILSWIPVVGGLANVVAQIFLMPWLIINFFVKDEFSALWDIEKVTNKVFKNIKEYVIAVLKQLAYLVIYGIASIVLVGIPCTVFGELLFMVDFYTRHK